MRSTSFVDRLTLEIGGDIAKHGVCLADVNSDGDYELVVGADNGDLLIFKGNSGVPWRKCSGLGFICAVGVGDLLNVGHPVIVVVSGCGWLNILNVHGVPSDVTTEQELKPLHTQRIPANVKDIIIGDINGDKSTELVISLTDRVVRTYKWVSCLGEETQSGRLISVNKWEFASQIGTVTLNHDTDGSPALLVAQPGGAFMKLKCSKETEQSENKGEVEEEEGQTSVLSNMSVEYEPLGVNRRRNPNVSAEILGGFKTLDGEGTRYAIVTLDGTIMLVDNCDKPPMESIMWNLQVDHQLMCLSKVDVTGDGLEEVVASSWDGQTYIIRFADIAYMVSLLTINTSQDRQAVRFQAEESVATFVSGMFSLKPGLTKPALVYVTFNNKIQLYHNLGLERGISLSSLVHWPGMLESAKELLQELEVDTEDMKQLQEVYRYCLYGVAPE